MKPKRQKIVGEECIEDNDGVKSDPRNREFLERRKKRKQSFKQQKYKDQIDDVLSRYKTLDQKIASTFDTFEEFPLSDRTLRGLKAANFKIPTDIQRMTLGHSIIGRDVVGAAKTGSGKTLALLIPLLECLWRNRWSKLNGIGALIITPTRELAFQIYQVLNIIGSFHEFSVALIIGGTDVEFEKSRMSAINIVICTPGRLLQHMDENEYFSCDQLQLLIIDEADRILDMGFRKQIDAIIENLPRERQTLLFSATQTQKVEDLIRVSLKDPVFISAHENSSKATPDQLIQTYFVCEEHEKINMLWSFLREHRRQKTLIFVTCCKQARFLTDAFCHLKPGMSLMGLWGDMKQTKRMDVFQRFGSLSNGAAMIATDVASRGLDFSGLDFVLQLDCPATVDDYIHRVGRTARMSNKGEAVLLLTPSQEPKFVEMLEKRNIPITKVEVHEGKKRDIRMKLSNLMVPFPQLKQFSQRSFIAYARAIYFMKLTEVFDVKSIDFDALARSYGLPVTPRIRFLQKRGIIPASGKPSTSKASTTEVVKLNKPETDPGSLALTLDSSESETEQGEKSDDDFLKVTRRDVFRTLEEVDTKEEILSRMSKKKAITKADIAKKMIRRLGNVSQKRKFDEEDEESS